MKHATCALTVTASGKMITPLFVFKGNNCWLIVFWMKSFSPPPPPPPICLEKPNGRIVQREFPTYPQGIIYACQDNAWMDERVMLMWVDMVLKPYVDTAPEDVVPIWLLDSYRCHISSASLSFVPWCEFPRFLWPEVVSTT